MRTTKILIGTKNSQKKKSTLKVFSKFFQGVKVIGNPVKYRGLKEPFNHQVFEGAEARAKELFDCNSQKANICDYYVGIECGINTNIKGYFVFCCTCLINNDGLTYMGTSSSLALPTWIISQVRKNNMSIIEIIRSEKKQTYIDAVSFLSQGTISRGDLLEQSLEYAIIPFLNPSLYQRQ